MKKQKPEPTPYELAQIAAALLDPAADYENQRYERLTKNALALWLTAQETLEKWRANPDSVFRPEPAKPKPKRYQEPTVYPVILDQFLKLMLPRARKEDHYPIFKRYLGYRLQHPLPLSPGGRPSYDCCNPRIVREEYSVHLPPPPPPPPKDDVDRLFLLFKSPGIPDFYSFHFHAKAFLDWYDAQLTEARRKAGQAGNKTRWGGKPEGEELTP